MSVALRLDALEAILQRSRGEETEMRSMMEEVKGEVRELARKIGAVEEVVDALRRGEELGTVEHPREEQERERVNMEVATGTLHLPAVFTFGISTRLTRGAA